jgi:hypothetical protein
MLGDAEYKPNIPRKSKTELPVQAKTLVGLKNEKTQGADMDIKGNVALAFESRTDITNEALPIT